MGVYLDGGLTFSKHIREAVIKAAKGASLLEYLSKYLSRKVLDLSYKLYLRPHLDYGDVIFHNQRTDLVRQLSLFLDAGRILTVKSCMMNLDGNSFLREGGVAV